MDIGFQGITFCLYVPTGMTALGELRTIGA